MSVYVLTMGFWPTYPTVSAILPQEVRIFIEKDFYWFEILVLPVTRNFYEILFKQTYWTKTSMAIYTRSLFVERMAERKGIEIKSRSILTTEIYLGCKRISCITLSSVGFTSF